MSEFNKFYNVERYVHPQGKVVTVNTDDSITITKDGKPAKSSSTLEELRAGRGAWRREDIIKVDYDFEEDPFSFELVKEYFENYNYDDLTTAIKNKAKKLGAIRLIKSQFGDIDLIFPNGIAASFFNQNNTSDRSLEIIEDFLIPGIWDEDEKMLDISENLPVYMQFKPSNEPVTSIALCGHTDFYERFGWWPHIELKASTDEDRNFVPLVYFGEAIFQGSRGYFFKESFENPCLDYESENTNIIGLPEDFKFRDFDPGLCFILEDKDNLPAWISKKALPEGKTGVYFFDPEDVDEDDPESLAVRIEPLKYKYPRFKVDTTSIYGDDPFTNIRPVIGGSFTNFFTQIPILTVELNLYDDNVYMFDWAGEANASFWYDENLEFRGI